VDPLTPREGLAGIALLAMFADGILRPDEDDVLRDRLSEHEAFAGLGESDVGRLLARMEEISRKRGPDALLRASCDAVRGGGMADAAFDVAAGIVEADGEVAPEESEFLQRLDEMLA
jgi:tellurite resistance protein